VECVVRNHEKIYMAFDSDDINHDWGEDETTKLLGDICDMKAISKIDTNVKYSDYFDISWETKVGSPRRSVL
jgi:hypothetical protein